ncbi:NDP-sugar synthase [Curvibacter sp. APW13]|uniref:NDP-sugar synthase n=1 Tax=Curvibacter sp. APW13 TaxID=3077236 RepID=UPI0028DEC72A|nr:NDP-sugar synthase [Curvibacter sp. APW13]MDT8992581.1 NDP-sugar synthase [Curvibacter sp. APW13]
MTKGMILAAGQGTRVRPLTQDLPKPMVPILGKPVMEYLIDHLALHGVNEIMVNVAWHHQTIENYFGDGSRWGVQIGYSYEGRCEHGEIVPHPMGSAGGMRRIQDFSRFFDSTTLVLCADALIDLDITASIQEHRAQGAITSVIGMEVPREDVQSYGVILADNDGRVQSFQEKPTPALARSTIASTGIYIFEPAALDLIPPDTVYDIGSQLFAELVKRDLPFFVQRRSFNWIDIGRVSDYWQVLQRVLAGTVPNMPMPGVEIRPGVWVGLNVSVAWDDVDVEGPVYLGSGVCIEPGVKIKGPVWVGHGCVLKSGSRITRSVLFEYTRIAADMDIYEMIVSRQYCVDRHGNTLYKGDDASILRWGDARDKSVSTPLKAKDLVTA